MNGTLWVAWWGATTGTAGTLIAGYGLVGPLWARRARVIGELRPGLSALRDAVAEAKARPRGMGRLLSTGRLSGHLDEIADIRRRTADRKLAKLLDQVQACCHAVAGTPDVAAGQEVPYAHRQRAEDALTALNAAFARMDAIDKRAPG